MHGGPVSFIIKVRNTGYFPQRREGGRMKRKKAFQELELKDAFMFTAVMEVPEICRQVLMRILGIPISKVQVHTESMILANPEYRGIRLDVYADDEDKTVYDVEMQTTDRGNLPRRSRCYQGQMDVASLEPGEDFSRLPGSYVIFICTFDPFGRGRYRYTYEERCIEDGEPLFDGTCKIFLNTRGEREEDVPKELVHFLHFAEHSNWNPDFEQDTLLERLEKRISGIKRNRRMEERYMLFGEMLDDERKEGREEGRSQLLSLIAAMSADGKSEEISRLSEEPEYLKEMLERYQVS